MHWMPGRARHDRVGVSDLDNRQRQIRRNGFKNAVTHKHAISNGCTAARTDSSATRQLHRDHASTDLSNNSNLQRRIWQQL